MTFGEKLIAARNDKGLTQKQLAEQLGITPTRLNYWEKDKRQPDVFMIAALASALEVSADYLIGNTVSRPVPDISADARKLARQFDALDDHGKRVVRVVIDEETARMDAEREQEETDPLPLVKIIPLLGTSAAAGPGEPDTGLDFTPYEVPADSKADFAVKITGDSMEPYLHDGDIALCVQRKPSDGEIVVMMVNGSLLVKQYITDGYNIYLRSLNRKRRDCDYDIWSTGSDTVRGYGTVIMQKVPLVNQWG